ncbi:MAG: lysoplasmalogenase [Burkholderiales bacterium]|nr:lysoplasmalogenase [Burkholderiales bacterium]
MLALAVLVAAGLAIASAPWALGQPWLNFVFKPLATVLIIVHAWRRGVPGDMQRRAVLAGLVLSLAGDVALLFAQGFVAGLVAFLLAHLAYLVAFTRRVRLAARAGPFVGYALLAALILGLLWPSVPLALRVPVVAYVLCLAAMAAQAAVQWLGTADADQRALARRAAIGGALFLASDALLATNRFALPLPASSLWVLGTYWTAQWLIASSLARRAA